MTVLKAFQQRIPPKIKISTRRTTILGWIIERLLTTHAGIQNFASVGNPRVHSKTLCVTNSNPLQQIAVLTKYFVSPSQSWILAFFPLTPDTQHVSSQSRWQASFLLEGITESPSSILGCIQRSNDQSQSHMFCLFLCFLFPYAPRLQCLWRRDRGFLLQLITVQCHAQQQRSNWLQLILHMT